MRVLICGYGSMGRRHARNARELGHEVVVTDKAEDRIRAAQLAGHDVKSDLPWADYDAVVIATPARTHLPVAKRLSDHGYSGPLFVEKPLDVETTCHDWWMQWPHKTTCVGYNWRFTEGMRWLAGQVVGSRPCRFSASLRTDMRRWPGADYASPLLECSHEINTALWLLGPAQFPEDDQTAAYQIGASWTLNLRHGIAASSTLHIEYQEPSHGEAGGSWGRNYTLRCGTDVYGCANVAEFLLHSDEARTRGIVKATYATEIATFLEAAEAGTPVPSAATFEDGLAVLKIIEQAEAMAR